MWIALCRVDEIHIWLWHVEHVGLKLRRKRSISAPVWLHWGSYFHKFKSITFCDASHRYSGDAIRGEKTQKEPQAVLHPQTPTKKTRTIRYAFGKNPKVLCGTITNYLTNYRRKFRSQTSDNMDRWKAEQGRGREKRKIRREKIRRERVRTKKMQMREKVGKSRNTVFFQWFVAPEGRKVGSLKGGVRSQLAR
jgi:hypothetical protein